MNKKAFFDAAASRGLGITYGDVRLVPGRSTGRLEGADFHSWFSRHVGLNRPIVSAAMDTVTDSRMSIAIASLGGMGIIPKSFSAEEQAWHVERVKNAMNGVSLNPIKVQVTATVAEVLEMCDEKGYDFRTFPVIDVNGKLVGMLTQNDINWCDGNLEISVKEAMTSQLITGKPGIDLEEAYSLMQPRKVNVLPLVDDQGGVAGLYVASDIRRARDKTALHNVDIHGQLRVGAAVDTGSEHVERALLLASKGVDVIVIDKSHGHSDPVIDMIKELKRQLPSTVDVVAGNISTRQAAIDLIEAGADGIKVGQGPGSICSTRIVAGIGVPQVTAVYDCAEAAREVDETVPVNADGGLAFEGDIPIALAAGAQSVMVGRMFAGTEEAPGVIEEYQGARYKRYRGMGSLSAMRESQGARDRYFESQLSSDAILPEGVDALVPYTGSLATIFNRCVSGIRKGMNYTGRFSVAELQKAEFIGLSEAGLSESRPHDLPIIRG